MKHYVLTMRDDDYWLTGPFPNGYAAIRWGNENEKDDQRWQVLALTNPHRVRIEHPDGAAVVDLPAPTNVDTSAMVPYSADELIVAFRGLIEGLSPMMSGIGRGVAPSIRATLARRNAAGQRLRLTIGVDYVK